MNKNPKVAIVIPTYNSAKFVRQSIESALNQTYKNIRVILIDDASTDNTVDILNEYAAKDDRITVMVNPENKGVGMTRRLANKVIDDCEFVTYVDSDDQLLSNFVEMCLMLQQQYDSDIVYPTMTIRYDLGGGRHYDTCIPSGDYIMSKMAVVQAHFFQKLKFLTSKLFRVSLINKIPWSDARVGEDVQVLFFACYFANSVRSSSYSGYIHHFREGSLLANADPAFVAIESCHVSIEIIDFLRNNPKRDADYKKILSYCENELKNGIKQLKILALRDSAYREEAKKNPHWHDLILWDLNN